MRILLCAGIFPPDVGGPATYTKILAEELTKRGHQVAVVCYSNSPTGETYSFPVTRVVRSKNKFSHYYRYYKAVKGQGRGFDVFYAQDPVSSGYPTFLAARMLKKPYVVKVTGDYSWEQARGRGLTELEISDFQKSPNVSFVIKKIRDVQIAVCRQARLVITPSQYLFRLVEGWGVGGEKMRVVHNALPWPEKFDKAALREELGFSKDDFVVFSAGRDVPWKGFSVLKQTVAGLTQKLPGLRLEIKHASPHGEILKFLTAADVFALNTGYEGFPHIVWEAFALGTPVLTTNVCGNPEIVLDRENGILVEFNNGEQLAAAISELYRDANLRKHLTEKGRETARQFSLESMVNQTEALLRPLAE